jgi:hypothetical protein
MRGKPLYRGVYRAAMALRALEPWKHLRPDDLVSLRIEGEAHPVLVTFSDGDPEEPSITLLRGPRALEQAFLLVGGGGGDEALAELDAVSLSFGPFEGVPVTRRRFLSRARLSPKGEEVPVLLVKGPREEPREPEDTEVWLVYIVLEGLLAALSQGLLPVGSRGDLGVLALTVSGTPRDSEVEVLQEGEPEERALPPTLGVDRPSLEEVPRLERDWLVGCPVAPFALEGSGEVARLLVVVEKGSGRLVDGLLVSGRRWHYAAASHLLDLFAGGGHLERPGMPRRLLLSSKVLAELLCPELALLGVPCRYDEATHGPVSDAADLLAARLVSSDDEGPKQ